MVILTVICVSMAIMSGVFWVIECRPAYAVMSTIRPQWNKIPVLSLIINPFILMGYVFKVMGPAKFFIIDFTATVVLAGIFSLGGVVGTTMGLSISNVISVALLIAMNKKPVTEEITI